MMLVAWSCMTVLYSSFKASRYARFGSGFVIVIEYRLTLGIDAAPEMEILGRIR